MEQATEVISTLTTNDNPVIALLACMVLVLAGVVIYQWKYTADKTVPKWVWDSFVTKFETVIDVNAKILLILDERLKK